ncbi:helix-turn-helix transcriptional regulator [Polynucleobacter asymbioticus]|jgi:predicted DNA-binding transcriptional regulator AlpA|uniref:Transcriptional regulator n=1 Tax=Polynucleobacter asymbioticus TaxID=576611 RepID=A0AAC9IUX5_9BURK|nr:AlpA family phage regulatory protein [Polynucleobacter asymbioticus]APB98822.1 transcriptional regulator [Polynucleobacter asymbioticus]APC01125.1 transcriptional regulator [Polynucleobacter asymbioticus]
MPSKVTSPKAVTLPHDGMSRWSQIKSFVPISREKFRQMVRDGQAPKPVRLGIRCTMWHNSELHKFLADPTGYDAGGK